jgi:hypothetical protein
MRHATDSAEFRRVSRIERLTKLYTTLHVVQACVPRSTFHHVYIGDNKTTTTVLAHDYGHRYRSIADYISTKGW